MDKKNGLFKKMPFSEIKIRKIFAVLLFISYVLFIGKVSFAENETETGDEQVLTSRYSFAEGSTLDLEECLEIAINNSRALKISSDKVDLAKIKKTVTYRDLFPSLSFFWSDIRGEDSVTANYSGSEYGVEMEQEVWPRDFLNNSYWQGLENVKFNESDYQKTERDLIFDVKKTFYELAWAKKDLKDQLEITKKAEKLSDLGEKEKDAGLISQLEYLKILSQYREFESQQAAREYIVKLRRVKLHKLIQFESDTLLDVDEKGLFDKERDDFLAKLEVKGEKEGLVLLSNYIDTALSGRLEMKLQERKLQFYKYGREATYGKGKPKISFVSSYKRIGDAYKPDKIEYEDEWFVGAKIAVPWMGNTLEYSYQRGESVPNRTSSYSTVNESETTNQSVKLSVLNNLVYNYDRKEAEISYDSAIKEKEEQARNIFLEVNEAFFNYENSVHKLITAAKKVSFALKEEEVTENMRQLGEEPLSKSLEALSNLQQARSFYNQALFEYFLSLLELDKAVGKQLASVK